MLKIVLLSHTVDATIDRPNRVHQALIESLGAGLTIRDLVHKLDFRSPAPLFACLRNLERQGKIKLVDGQPPVVAS